MAGGWAGGGEGVGAPTKFSVVIRSDAMNSTSGIRWGRILIAGILAELFVVVLLAPVYLVFGEQAAVYSTTWASFVGLFTLAVWVGRKIDSRFVLHGLLVSVVAILFYITVTLAQPESLLYIAAHAFKLLGGATGGFYAERRKQRLASGMAVSR